MELVNDCYTKEWVMVECHACHAAVTSACLVRYALRCICWRQFFCGKLNAARNNGKTQSSLTVAAIAAAAAAAAVWSYDDHQINQMCMLWSEEEE